MEGDSFPHADQSVTSAGLPPVLTRHAVVPDLDPAPHGAARLTHPLTTAGRTGSQTHGRQQSVPRLKAPASGGVYVTVDSTSTHLGGKRPSNGSPAGTPIGSGVMVSTAS